MKVETVDDIEGINGVAYEIGWELEDSDDPRLQGTVAVWFIHAPNQTPFWHHYLLSIIHLRNIDGVEEPAKKQFPSATHEVLLFALVPEPENTPSPDNPETWRPMTPYNVVEQVEVPSDGLAKDLLRHAAQAIVEGVIWAEPPLSGQREPWRTVLIKTSAHLRGEPHAS